MNALGFRNIALVVIGLFFAVNGIGSGNPGSAVIGILLAAIAFFVAFTGKVHKKFYKKFDTSCGAMTTAEDQELVRSVKSLINRLSGKAGENTGE